MIKMLGHDYKDLFKNGINQLLKSPITILSYSKRSLPVNLSKLLIRIRKMKNSIV